MHQPARKIMKLPKNIWVAYENGHEMWTCTATEIRQWKVLWSANANNCAMLGKRCGHDCLYTCAFLMGDIFIYSCNDSECKMNFKFIK